VLRILLVDDHALVRSGLKAELAREPDLRIEWEAGTVAEALRLFREHRPDVTLLDIGLPDGDGVACLRTMLAEQPAACVIMLSSHLHERDVRRATAAGARGYLGKTIAPGELAAAIRAMAAGEKIVRDVLTHSAPGGTASPELSEREMEVLGCLRRGFSNADIGRTLGITERTARAHVEAILRKRSAADRAEAVAIGFERGLLRLD
jgi:DNA-binding NarL/FixJ family response regulator